jgi:hypothetical protein
MIKLIFMLKKIFTAFVFAAIISGAFLSPLQVFAQDGNYGLDTTAGQIDAFKDQRGKAFADNFIQTRAGEIIGLVLSFVGILFLGLMIYAGLMWMTAQGNETKVTKAKDLLVNAVIGLIIVFAAYAITAFVGEFVTNKMLN